MNTDLECVKVAVPSLTGALVLSISSISIAQLSCIMTSEDKSVYSTSHRARTCRKSFLSSPLPHAHFPLPWMATTSSVTSATKRSTSSSVTASSQAFRKAAIWDRSKLTLDFDKVLIVASWRVNSAFNHPDDKPERNLSGGAAIRNCQIYQFASGRRGYFSLQERADQ